MAPNRYLSKLYNEGLLDKIAAEGIPAIVVEPEKGRAVTYDAADYLTKVKPMKDAKDAAIRSAVGGIVTGITYGVIKPGTAKEKLMSILESTPIITAVSAGATGGVTYHQAKKKGRESLKFINKHQDAL
jgi:hypothetical protein